MSLLCVPANFVKYNVLYIASSFRVRAFIYLYITMLYRKSVWQLKFQLLFHSLCSVFAYNPCPLRFTGVYKRLNNFPNIYLPMFCHLWNLSGTSAMYREILVYIILGPTVQTGDWVYVVCCLYNFAPFSINVVLNVCKNIHIGKKSEYTFVRLVLYIFVWQNRTLIHYTVSK